MSLQMMPNYRMRNATFYIINQKIHPTFIQDFFFQITKFCFYKKDAIHGVENRISYGELPGNVNSNFFRKRSIRPQHHILKLRHFCWRTTISLLWFINCILLSATNIYSTKFYFDKVAAVVGLCCNHWSVSLTLGVAFIMQLNNDRESLSKQNPSGIYLLSFLKNQSLEENQYTCTKYIVFKEKMSNTANIYVADQPQQT